MEILKALAKAREIEPYLTCYGIGVYESDNNQEVLDAGFKSIRPDHVEKICELLSNCKKTKRVNSDYGSYSLKHKVEKALAAYTTNGEMIAAMIIAGFKHKRDGYICRGRKLSPNASFNISAESVRWIESQNKNAGW